MQRGGRCRGRRFPCRGQELDVNIGKQGQCSNLHLECVVGGVIYKLDKGKGVGMRGRKNVGYRTDGISPRHTCIGGQTDSR
jgi:hypothetical protein